MLLSYQLLVGKHWFSPNEEVFGSHPHCNHAQVTTHGEGEKCHQGRQKVERSCLHTHFMRNTVHGSEIRRAPVEVGRLSQCLQDFTHPRWCRISSINSIAHIFELATNKLIGFGTCWMIWQVILRMYIYGYPKCSGVEPCIFSRKKLMIGETSYPKTHFEVKEDWQIRKTCWDPIWESSQQENQAAAIPKSIWPCWDCMFTTRTATKLWIPPKLRLWKLRIKR